MDGSSLYAMTMAGQGNILITDESSLHVLMHGDWAGHVESSVAQSNPLLECATTLNGLKAFNVCNPLYGPPPVSLLVSGESQKRKTGDLICRYMLTELPSNSFFFLREGLFAATPEFVYLRMARLCTETQLAEIGMNLCGRYYINVKTGAIEDRTAFLTTPEKLKAYVMAAQSARGAKKALSVLKWVMPNSGSPYETKMKLVYCQPMSRGGLNLPFTDMNYDVRAGRLSRITSQSKYSIDLVDRLSMVAAEFDGEESHPDASKDKRRRNELAALGWDVFPIDKKVLHDPEATMRAGEQMARRMKIRLRKPPTWEKKYLQLRRELNLPT